MPSRVSHDSSLTRGRIASQRPQRWAGTYPGCGYPQCYCFRPLATQRPRQAGYVHCADGHSRSLMGASAKRWHASLTSGVLFSARRCPHGSPTRLCRSRLVSCTFFRMTSLLSAAQQRPSRYHSAPAKRFPRGDSIVKLAGPRVRYMQRVRSVLEPCRPSRRSAAAPS